MLAMNGHSDLQGAQIRRDYRPYGAALTKAGITGASRNGSTFSTTSSMSSPAKASASAGGDDQQRRRHRHMWIVTGPAGCGKSAVASFLADELDIPYIEGDDYHPVANRQKMAQNIPLTDADRWDWLITLRNAAMARLSASTPSSPSSRRHQRPLQHAGVVVTCSALKRKYRDVIRVAAYEDHGVRVHFIYLHAPESVLLQRVAARKGHFMGSGMVHSQFESLEEPGSEEMGRDVLSCDCTAELDVVENHVLEEIRRVLEREGGSGSSTSTTTNAVLRGLGVEEW